MANSLKPFAAIALQGGRQLIFLVQGCHIIATSNAAAAHQHIGNGATACVFAEKSLQLGSQRMLVKLHHIRCGNNRVFVQDNRFGSRTVRAV